MEMNHEDGSGVPVRSFNANKALETMYYFNRDRCSVCIKFTGKCLTGIKKCRFHSLLQVNVWRQQLDNRNQFHADFHLNFKWSRTFLASSGSIPTAPITRQFHSPCIHSQTTFGFNAWEKKPFFLLSWLGRLHFHFQEHYSLSACYLNTQILKYRKL